MKKLILLFFAFLFITSCDDGDFDVPSFVFGTNVNNCGDLILFNISDSSNEALILNLNEDNTDDLFFVTERTDESFDLNNRISYRIFNGNVGSSYFCQNIPPASPGIIEEWNGGGDLIVSNSITRNDNDGVVEDDFTIDSDSDSVFDYLDIDDDDDGVLTSDELGLDNDGDNFLDFLDTDGDSIPNHLDADDDGDGVPTINELRTDSNANDIIDYLDNSTSDTQTAFPPLQNKHTLSYTTTFIIENMSLTNSNGNVINYNSYQYGVKTGDVIIMNN